MEKKAQRLVHKVLAISILLFLNISFAQDNISKREILVLNKIIDDSRRNSQLTSYIIEKPISLNEGNLKDYYEYRYEGKIKNKIILGVINDSLVYDTDEKNKEAAKMLFSHYAVLDSYFSQSDLKRALDQDNQQKWEADDFKSLHVLKSEEEAVRLQNGNVYIYKLSRPFFSADGNFMGIYIQGNTAKFAFSTNHLLIFKLENDKWIKIEK